MSAPLPNLSSDPSATEVTLPILALPHTQSLRPQPQSNQLPKSPYSIAPHLLKDKDLHTFDPFPRLAPEMRTKIWKLAMPRSRVVTITNKADGGALTTEELLANRNSRCHTAPPAILQASREGRYTTLEFYTLCGQDFLIGGKQMYINFEHDILHLARGCYNLAKILSVSSIHQVPSDDTVEPEVVLISGMTKRLIIDYNFVAQEIEDNFSKVGRVYYHTCGGHFHRLQKLEIKGRSYEKIKDNTIHVGELKDVIWQMENHLYDWDASNQDWLAAWPKHGKGSMENDKYLGLYL